MWLLVVPLKYSIEGWWKVSVTSFLEKLWISMIICFALFRRISDRDLWITFRDLSFGSVTEVYCLFRINSPWMDVASPGPVWGAPRTMKPFYTPSSSVQILLTFGYKPGRMPINAFSLSMSIWGHQLCGYKCHWIYLENGRNRKGYEGDSLLITRTMNRSLSSETIDNWLLCTFRCKCILSGDIPKGTSLNKLSLAGSIIEPT